MQGKCHSCLCRTCLHTCCSRKSCKGKTETCRDYSGFRQLGMSGQGKKQKMQVLVACEESQRVCMEFRRLGHEAYSCDIEPCSGGHPEWHIQADVLPLLGGGCIFRTADGMCHMVYGKWDIIIAHPPCTYLSNAGAARLYPQKGVLNQERYKKGMEAKEFFMEFYNSDCPRIAIENPVPTRVYGLPEYSQIIQPYEHGHPYSKKTCLWLKGLPDLEPTRVVTGNIISWVSGGSRKTDGTKRGQAGTKFRDAKTRSKTFPGIAKAMAEQWGKVAFATMEGGEAK